MMFCLGYHSNCFLCGGHATSLGIKILLRLYCPHTLLLGFFYIFEINASVGAYVTLT